VVLNFTEFYLKILEFYWLLNV